MAAICCFSGAIIALAAEPNNQDSVATEVQNEFDIISSLNDVNRKSNGFTFKVSNVKAESAKLTFKSEELCISYRICKYNVLKKRWDEYLTTPNTELKLVGLKPNTAYKFSVFNAATDELLGIKKFTTDVKKPVVSIKKVNGTSIKLGLKNIQKGAKVKIYRKTAGKKYKKIATVSSKKRSYTDKKLAGATKYTYKVKTVVSKKKNGKKTTKSSSSKAKSAKTLLKMGLPSVSGKTKTYAYYTAVTARNSPQYRLLNSEECYTDPETGIRMVDGCYCVALGSYYGTRIGTKYRITFSTGTAIDVILCDQKADRHTDSRHQYAVNNKDIVEFYVEGSKMPRIIRNRGNFGIIEKFSGSVVSIEKYV